MARLRNVVGSLSLLWSMAPLPGGVCADLMPPKAARNLRLRSGGSATPTPSCSPASLYPMIHTMSVNVDSPYAETDHATIRYRPAGAAAWTTGHDAVLANTGRVHGCLFWLSPATTYDVEVTSRRSDGTAIAVNQCQATTQADVPATTVVRTLHVVAGAAPGGDGSLANPYATIQAAVNAAYAGDEIDVAPGVYREEVVFPRSGTAGNYIRVIGQAGAILDAGDLAMEQNGFAWAPDGTYANVYSTTIPANFYNAANLSSEPIWRDGSHFYTYDSLAALQTGTGHGGTAISEGRFYDAATRVLTIRSLTAPGGHTWHIRTHDSAMKIWMKHYIWVEGLTIRYYPNGVYIRSSNNTVLRNNTFQTGSGILVDDSGGATPTGNRIEGNTLANPPTADWGYLAVKGTVMESGAIASWQGTGTIIRDNRLSDYFNGIFAGGTVADTDIYRNVVRHMGDDGLELDGRGENLRAWGNAVDDVLSAVSLAPIETGPVWILFNRFTQFTGRGYKIGGGVTGFGFIYHNTTWTDIANSNATQQIGGDANNYVLRNNILRARDLAIRWTAVMPGIHMDYDNAYSLSLTQPYYWNAVYTTLAAVCAAEGAECHGSQAEPGLIDPANLLFGPAVGSPNIDTALPIPGINDTFTGAGPDRGYVEQGQAEIVW